ncbi:MAG: hypothetical protein L0387_28360 [Acidobacteria bacterium]|nr:hypothetical protein [Acidobacteriota bacterium]
MKVKFINALNALNGQLQGGLRGSAELNSNKPLRLRNLQNSKLSGESMNLVAFWFLNIIVFRL